MDCGVGVVLIRIRMRTRTRTRTGKRAMRVKLKAGWVVWVAGLQCSHPPSLP